MEINLRNGIFFLNSGFFKRKLLIMMMRFFIFLFCMTLFSMNPNNAISQNSKIKIESDRTLSVDEVFDLIMTQTNYKFVYQEGIFAGFPKIRIKKGIVRTSKLLKRSLFDGNLDVMITKSNTILIKKKATSEKLQEQLKGVVSDEAGEPLAGVSIYLKNDPTKGWSTNFDGEFAIVVPVGKTIIFSHVGFVTQEHVLTSALGNTLNITLKEALNKLDKVVITGYTKTKKTVSSAAASKITKKQINRQVTTNLDQKLEGMVSGLSIASVTPDGGENRLEIIIRGRSTIDEPVSNNDESERRQARDFANRQPLIVVDGFPYEGHFNDIDSETIEMLDVLKDAVATALWGNRASNGVIVITTKRGVAGKANISFTSRLITGTKQDLEGLGLASSAETIKVLSAYQELEGLGFSNRLRNIANGTRKYGNVNAFENIWLLYHRGSITEGERDAQLMNLGQVDNHSDFQNNLLRSGIVYQNSLSVRGGSEEIRYSFVGSHVNEERPDVGDDFNRLNLALTTNLKLSEKLSANLDVALATSNQENNGIGSSALFTGAETAVKRFSRLTDNAGNPLSILGVNSEDVNDFNTAGFDRATYNPILDQKLRDNSIKGLNLRLSAGLNYKITYWLGLDLKYQHNRMRTTTRNNKGVNLFETRRNNNSYITDINSANGIVRAVPYGGTLERNENLTVNNIYRGALSFNKAFNGVHTLSALAGMEVEESVFNGNRQHFVGYDDRTGQFNNNFNLSEYGSRGTISGTVLGTGNFRNREFFDEDIINRNISSFTNFGYNYKDKYNFEISGKINQATAFGLKVKLRKPLLWGTGISWNIHKENFFKANWVDELKLRLSYGVNGSIRRGLTSVTTIRLAIRNRLNGQPYALVNRPGNKSLSFEETTTKNIGLDFGLFKRIRGSVEVYERLSENLFTPNEISSTYGQGTQIFANNGKISNTGFELQLTTDIIDTENLKWNTNVNYSYNKNEVIAFGVDNSSFNAGTYSIVYRNGAEKRIGQPLSSQVRYNWAGLDDEGNPQIYDKDLNVIGFKEFPEVYNDLDSDALVSTKPFVAPSFGGMTNTFTYKKFTLSFLMTYKFGHVFQEDLNKKYPYLSLGGGHDAFHEDIANAWENPGDENTTDIPAIPRTKNSFEFFPVFKLIHGENGGLRRTMFTDSNLFMHDAAFVRLKDITLNYQLDKEFVKDLGINSVNFLFQARNLGLLWTANDQNIDPESVPLSGRSITFGRSFPIAFRPGIKIPVSLVFGVKLNF